MGVSKSFAVFLVLIMAVSSLIIVGTTPFGLAQNGTTINSMIINSDTTWTKANSPYNLAGPVAISQGATLTIDSGATVNLNNHYLLVNGTINAKGSNTEKVNFNGGDNRASYIEFMNPSPSWNKNTQLGSIIENSILKSIWIKINGTSPKINDNTITGYISCQYSSTIITNNEIFGEWDTMSIFKSSATISGNVVHNINWGIYTDDDASTISNNTVIGGEIGIIYNSFHDIYVLSNNTVYGCKVGIKSGPSCRVEENIVINNYQGIVASHSIILKNTIVNNTVGIIAYPTPRINNNNIYGNSENIHLAPEANENVDATNNWWGTTNSAMISQTIHDKKNDFNLGTVNFTPFLTAPNPEAPTIPTSTPTTTPKPTPTLSPTATPTVPEFPVLAILTFFVPVLLAAVYLKHRRTTNE